MSTMMRCGHTANATAASGAPICVICIGIDPGAVYPVDSPPDLTGRMARCDYKPVGHKDVPSRLELPFFSYRPTEPFDHYYCGCYGWD